jgi:hypothetical protein
MVDEDPEGARTSGFWAGPRFSWILVMFGLALLHFSKAPSLPEQIALCSHGLTSQNLLILGYLLAISVLPILGLWRLSLRLGLPRYFALLYPVFPLAIVGVYLVKPLLDFARDRKSTRLNSSHEGS